MPSRKNKQIVVYKDRTVAVRQRGKRAPRNKKVTRKALSFAVGKNLGNMAMAEAYLNSLNDPFEYEGVRLGWGCLVPSTVATAYLRTTINANADGSLGLIATPCGGATGILQSNNAGAAVASWASNACTDSAALAANFSTGRCISIGIKAFPSIAATSAPGASFAGALVGETLATATALTPNDLEALPSTQMGIGTNGATATGRPVDTTSFAFNTACISVAPGAPLLQFSLPYICFEGLPASSPVVVEVVMNFEGLALNTHGSSGLGQGAQGGETLASSWPHIERVMEVISPRLIQVAKNTISSLAAGAANTLGQFAARQINMPMNRRMRIVD